MDIIINYSKNSGLKLKPTFEQEHSLLTQVYCLVWKAQTLRCDFSLRTQYEFRSLKLDFIF